MRLGYSFIYPERLGSEEKSIYASSTTNIPSKVSASLSIWASGNAFPVGLFGEHTNISFVSASHAPSKSWTGRLNSAPRGTSRICTLLISAATLYIPYVGAMLTALSLPGSQNIRKHRSMASSLPLPMNIFFTGMPFIRDIRALSSACRGSG